jgi:hypothetical protein
MMPIDFKGLFTGLFVAGIAFGLVLAGLGYLLICLIGWVCSHLHWS